MGETFREAPAPTAVPPQLLEYHCQLVELLSEPLVTVSLWVEQLMGVVDTEGVLAGMGAALITTFGVADEGHPAASVTVKL